MSAFEKLKALGEFHEDDRVCMACLCSTRFNDSMSDALPQIVAVVGLAEGIAQTDAPVWGTRDGLGFKMQNALADLEEALK